MTHSFWRNAITGAALVAMASVATATVAQEETEAEAPQGPVWLATCSNQNNPDVLACSMSQTLNVASSGQRLLAVTVQPDAEAPNVLLSLPHGLNFANGVGVRTDDGEEERFAFTTADATGTYARVPLTRDLLSAMRAANTLSLNVVGVGGREVNFEVSLSGFSKTYDLLR